MDYPTIELKWEEILSSAITGLLRQTESMRQQINWGHGANFDIYKQWGMTVSGSICEQALAKKMDSYFPHSVNNFKGSDLHIDGKSIQVRSQLMTKKTNNLIIRQGYKESDYYFLVGDETPIYTFFGYISAKDIRQKGNWTNFGINTRPYVWSVPIGNLKPITEFKNER